MSVHVKVRRRKGEELVGMPRVSRSSGMLVSKETNRVHGSVEHSLSGQLAKERWRLGSGDPAVPAFVPYEQVYAIYGRDNKPTMQ
jgi:hypothetical protein